MRLERISGSLADFKDDIGRFPTMEEGLRALLEKPATINNEAWKGPYVDRPDIPPDPWLKDYLYIYPAKFGSEEFDLYSTGQNEVDDHGLKDDITNWKPVDHRYYPHSSNNNLWFIGVSLVTTLVLLITFLIKKRVVQSRDDHKG